MPLVTVASRPNGEPIATTFSPTVDRRRRADGGRLQAGDVLGLDHGEVGERVGADDGRLLGRAVVEAHRDLAALADRGDVVVGEDLAVGADDDARAGALALGAADVDLHDGGQHARRPPPRRSRPRGRRPCGRRRGSCCAAPSDVEAVGADQVVDGGEAGGADQPGRARRPPAPLPGSRRSRRCPAGRCASGDVGSVPGSASVAEAEAAELGGGLAVAVARRRRGGSCCGIRLASSSGPVLRSLVGHGSSMPRRGLTTTESALGPGRVGAVLDPVGGSRGGPGVPGTNISNCAPPLRCVTDAHQAAVPLRDLAHDGQAEPGAGQRAGVGRAVEPVEDVRQVLLGDPVPLVGRPSPCRPTA